MALPRTSPLYLVLFILAFILCCVGIYMLHQNIHEPDGLKATWARVDTEVANAHKDVARKEADVQPWRDITGYTTPQAIYNYFEGRKLTDPSVSAPLQSALTQLQDAINAKLTRLGQLRQRIAAVQKQIDEKKAAQAAASAAGRAELDRLSKQINAVNDEISKAEAAGEKQIETLRDKLADLDNQIETLTKQWAEKKAPLDERVAKLKATADAMREKMKTGTGFQAPADGKVLTVDYTSGRVTINLGRDNYRDITVNTKFDIYGQGKGETVKPKAAIKVIKVGPKISEAVLTEPASGDDNVVVPGDYVEPPIARFRDPKFAIEGYFPGPYSPEQLAMLVKEYGGTLSPEVEVDTRYLIVGMTDSDAEGLDETAKAAARAGQQALNTARQYGVTILTVEKFLDKVGRTAVSAR